MLERHSQPNRFNSGAADAEALVGLFRAFGWDVAPATPQYSGMVIRRGRQRYVVEVKASAEGRADRVIPLLSQAILEAGLHAGVHAIAQPLAVVCVGRLTRALRDKAAQFHARYAPDVAVGLIGRDGGRWFVGAGLDALNAEPEPGSSAARRARAVPGRTHNLFSDLSQWLLKVLLAPELPEQLLRAPRRAYRTAADLADAAQVSAMSVSRFIRRLREEGFLDESAPTLQLVRRRELFGQWQANALRTSAELPMRFLSPGAPQQQLAAIVARHPNACIGLFAAASLLGAGHVADGLPWVYVRALPEHPEQAWPELAQVQAGEPLQLMLKQAAAPESVFRGAVQVQGAAVTDILQVWLDVASHPARGKEQADFLANTVLADVFGRCE